MLLFVRMPSLSIQVFECANESELLSILRDLHVKYDPLFPIRIATISKLRNGDPCGYGKFRKLFNDEHISKTSQFKPSPSLMDFINENHDGHPLFRMQEYVKGWEDVVDSTHSKNFISVNLDVVMEKDILLEGSRTNVNPMDMLRDFIRLCMNVRKASYQHGDVERAMDDLRFYLTGKRD